MDVFWVGRISYVIRKKGEMLIDEQKESMGVFVLVCGSPRWSST